MRYKIQSIRHPEYEGDLIPFVVDSFENNYIEPSAAIWGWKIWLLEKLGTANNKLRDLCVFYEFVDLEYPEFFSDAAKLKFIDNRRLLSLSSFLLRNFQEGEGVSIKPGTYNRRVDSIAAFLDFHYQRYINRQVDLDRISELNRLKDRVIKGLRKTKYKRADVERSTDITQGFSDKEVDLIRLLSRPSTSKFTNEVNPFRRSLQLRNAIIIELLLQTGGRLSEILLIRANDDDLKLTENPTIVIQDHSYNSGKNSRGRMDAVSHKTLNREVPITRGLANMIEDYLDKDRVNLRRLAKGHRTPYLLVSEKDGGAMSRSGLRHVLDRLSSSIPGLEHVVSPHRFRTTASTNLRSSIDNNYDGTNSPLVKSGEIEDLMTYQYGWVKGSEMVQRYTRAHLMRKVNEYLSGKET